MEQHDIEGWASKACHLQAERDKLLEDKRRLVEALNRCREEFCWHGNTGKSLNAGIYGELVDMIDAAMAELGERT